MSRARLGLMALASLCMTELALADDAGLGIETGSPDALCPELASTRAAVSRRLGALRLPAGSSGYRARYTIGHAPVGSPGDFVRLELFGPEGALQLARDLPLEGESCSTMAEVIALVLDRYFRALLAGEPEKETVRTDGQPAPSAAASAGTPLGTPQGTPQGTPPAAASAEVPASVPPPAGSVDVPRGAGDEAARGGLRLIAFELAFRNPVLPALGVRGILEPWPSIYLGTALHVGLKSDTEDLQGGGEVASRDVMLRAYAGWGAQLGPVRTYIGPGLRVGLSRGAGRALAQNRAGVRLISAFGLDAGAIWVTDDGWTFGASAALDISFSELSGRFMIEGQEVLALEPVRGWLGMVVGYAF
jgi:hypothetical protein